MVIERYFALLNTETKRVNAMFTAEEWNALYNAASSTSWNTGRDILAVEIKFALT